MGAKAAVLQALEDVLGIEKEELEGDLDFDLIENGLIDSLAIVTTLTQIEGYTGKKLQISKMSPQSFVSVNAIISAVSSQV